MGMYTTKYVKVAYRNKTNVQRFLAKIALPSHIVVHLEQIKQESKLFPWQSCQDKLRSMFLVKECISTMDTTHRSTSFYFCTQKYYNSLFCLATEHYRRIIHSVLCS
mmetsp:Transcript_19562/g.29697  ORF Transcript_19562/g.29697 Transcript_19562/m.29697 type:complete len:107 (-) Transcript_19562:593-913(-)